MEGLKMSRGYFVEGGPFMWLLLFFLIAIIVISAKKGFDLFLRKTDDDYKLEKGINAILFFGFLSLICGILAQITGIYIALGEIIRATDISPQITMMGFRQSFTPTLFGLWILIIAAVSWFMLRSRYKSMIHS